MFTVYHSNDLDLLKDLICHIIDNDKINDPFVLKPCWCKARGCLSGCKSVWQKNWVLPRI